MECTLAAKDKALQRIETKEGIVIAEQNRPQKVRVIVDSKTSIMVYPNEAENAIARFNKRYQQSQEQSHNHQRKPIQKSKVKQQQSDLIFYN
jgi:formylmethanofuran dehydrogenase subunit E